MKDRLFINLELGKDYICYYHYKNKMRCRLIQPTEKGFNLLNLKTSKCILKRHIYPSKYENHIKTGNLWFYLNMMLTIEKIN